MIKYNDPSGLFVEVIQMDSDRKSHVLDRIQLPDKHDGLFNFKGHVTRLAIADIDGDGQNELLIPSFDAQLVPHLNVFKFNKVTNRFEPAHPSNENDPSESPK